MRMVPKLTKSGHDANGHDPRLGAGARPARARRDEVQQDGRVAERRIERLIGVYEAKGGLFGELQYIAARVTGRGHCSLCDVTHRGLRPKADWEEFRRGLPVPLELVHLNERSEAVREATERATPCVLGQVGPELVILLGPDDLEACRGEVTAFADSLARATADHGMSLGEASSAGGAAPVVGADGLPEPDGGHQ